MSAADSIWLFQAVHAVGLAIWLTIAVINNLQAFQASVGAGAWMCFTLGGLRVSKGGEVLRGGGTRVPKSGAKAC